MTDVMEAAGDEENNDETNIANEGCCRERTLTKTEKDEENKSNEVSFTGDVGQFDGVSNILGEQKQYRIF